jgi:hypothetical protein
MTAAGDGATAAVPARRPGRNAMSPLRQAADRAMTTSCAPPTTGTSRAGADGAAPPTRTCPRCNGSVYRVPRRVVDRLLSVFVAVRRHRCDEIGCHWEGNLRNRPATQPAPEALAGEDGQDPWEGTRGAREPSLRGREIVVAAPQP